MANKKLTELLTIPSFSPTTKVYLVDGGTSYQGTLGALVTGILNNFSFIPFAAVGTGDPNGRVLGNSGQYFWDYNLKGFWIKESGNANMTGWYYMLQGA